MRLYCVACSQCGAVSFIENISADNLNMSEEEFKVHMGYVDGKSDADLLIESEQQEHQQTMETLHVLKVRFDNCQCFHLLTCTVNVQSCCQGMKELSSHLQLLLVEARELEGKMDEFRDGLKEQVSSILTTPNTPVNSTPDLIDLKT